MDAKSLLEQEKDIRDLLRRAERTPVKTSTLRKDTLKRLIDLAHSPRPSLKTIAATHLKLFIKDFPELEDDAINAVYDLCEDPASSVRIKGYAAIVDVSREQSKWVKRNVDVLVQLLQSDEPEEVTVVKRALTQHLDMDPVVTLGVLCDQVIPQDEPLDEEEQSIRDRLRSLVLAFLAGEAKRPLIERHACTIATPAEQMIVSGLFKAIAKLPPADVDYIVKDILTSLPSFKSSSSRGLELLDTILVRTRAALKSDLSGVENTTLSGSRCYLDLASYITVDKQLARPTDLLRFYYTSLTPKLVLARLSEEDQAYVINSVARTFAASEDTSTRKPSEAPAGDLSKISGNASNVTDEVAIRRQFLDVCVILFQVFADMKSEEYKPWTACLTLVQGVRRKQEARWHIPDHVFSALRRLECISIQPEASPESKAAQEQVHSVIRSLLKSVKPLAPPATQAVPTMLRTVVQDPQKGANANADQRRVMNVSKRKLDASGTPNASAANPRGSIAPGLGPSYDTSGRPAFLPPRPSAATVASSVGGAPSAPRVDRQRQRQPPPHLQGNSERLSPTSSAVPATQAGPSTNGIATHRQAGLAPPRSAKRTRVEGREQEGGEDTGGLTPSWSVSMGGRAAELPVLPTVMEAKPVPSLLSRLAGHSTNGDPVATSTLDREEAQHQRRGQGQAHRNKREREVDRDGKFSNSSTIATITAKRHAEPSTSQFVPTAVAQTMPAPLISGRGRQLHPTETDKDPVGGYSIRGAAKASSRGPWPSELGDGPERNGSGSLLERMQGHSEGSEPGLDSGGRRKKRTKY